MHAAPAAGIHAALDQARFGHGLFADVQALRAQARRRDGSKVAASSSDSSN